MFFAVSYPNSISRAEQLQFFFGDPVRMHSALYEVYDKGPYVERIQAFLKRSGKPAEVTG